MGISRALTSFVNCVTNEQFRADHLKLCVLWYDEVLFENLGAFDQARFFEKLLDEERNAGSTIKTLSDLIVPLTARISSESLRQITEAEPQGYPRWGEQSENYNYPEPDTAEQYAHNRLLAKIASEHGVEHFRDGDAIELAEGRARVATNAVRLWDYVNRELPCMLQASPDEKLAIEAAQEFVGDTANPCTPFQLFEIAIPSLSNVPWSRVVELRGNGSFAQLRTKMAEAVGRSGASIEAAKKEFDEVEKSVMEEIIEFAEPRPKKAIVEAVLANIPGLPVNPFSLYFGVRDSASAIDRSIKHGWLYLLRDIRGVADLTEAK